MAFAAVYPAGRVYGSSSGLPAWREAMTETNRIYEIGERPATVMPGRIEWPSAGSNNFLMSNGNDALPWRCHAGYGGSVYVPEIGQYGAMVYGTTGESTISNQLGYLSLSAGTPTWNFFQQPVYPINSAEADTMDADWYYSEADYAALASAKKIDLNESGFSAGWDGTFPVGYKNFVARRKYSAGGIVGNNRPHWHRYGSMCYIPPAMTGDSEGMLLTNQRGTIYGPFAQGPMPASGSVADWYSDVWGSGRAKYYLWGMSVQSRTWQRLESEAVPDISGTASNIAHPFAIVDEANKRVYYTTEYNFGLGYYYADFSAGHSGMTMVGPTSITSPSGYTAWSQNTNAVLCVPQSGALAGKRLVFVGRMSQQQLFCWDMDTDTLHLLAISGLPDVAYFWALSYDPGSNRVFITVKNTAIGVRSYRFAIPDDFADAADYTVTMEQLDITGVTLDSLGDTSRYQYGERSKYLEDLGVIILTQPSECALAYRPE